MHPTSGNGVGMTIEDTGALGEIMKGLDDLNDVSKCLRVWDSVRRPRASAVQLLCRMVGLRYEITRETKDLVKELLSDEELPEFTQAGMDKILFSYDCLGQARKAPQSAGIATTK